jgi:hypothetical protein
MNDKSVPLALLLAFLFGPLGLMYASLAGGVFLVLVAAAGVVPTLGFVLVFVWPASMVWAVVAASAKHRAYVTH